MTRRRRNDSGWRAQCLEARGAWCRVCGGTGDLQVHHVVPRSQGGPSVVENGQVVCGPWSTTSPHAGGCHAAFTEHRLLNRREWLDPDQVEWLAEFGWVRWDDDGEVSGRGCRSFALAG